MRAAVLSGILFLSGASALLFEMLWLRLSRLTFGNSGLGGRARAFGLHGTIGNVEKAQALATAESSLLSKDQFVGWLWGKLQAQFRISSAKLKERE